MKKEKQIDYKLIILCAGILFIFGLAIKQIWEDGLINSDICDGYTKGSSEGIEPGYIKCWNETYVNHEFQKNITVYEIRKLLSSIHNTDNQRKED